MQPTIECIGPCLLKYKGTLGGETMGPVNFIDKLNTVASMVSSAGSTKRKKYVEGEEVAVEAVLAELDIDNLELFRAGSEVDGTTNEGLRVKTQIGRNLMDDAGPLIVIPIVDGVASTTKEDWLFIPLASVEVDANVEFSANGQKGYKVRFEGHPVKTAASATGDYPAFEVGDLYVWGKPASA